MNISWHIHWNIKQANKHLCLYSFLYLIHTNACIYTHIYTHIHCYFNRWRGNNQATGTGNDYTIAWWQLATGTVTAAINAIDPANCANSRQKSSNGVTIKIFTIPCTIANPMPWACEMYLSSTASNHKNELVHLTVTPRHTETSTPFIRLQCRCSNEKISMAAVSATVTVTVTAANLANAHCSNA